jgi:hypothetical protein
VTSLIPYEHNVCDVNFKAVGNDVYILIMASSILIATVSACIPAFCIAASGAYLLREKIMDQRHFGTLSKMSLVVCVPLFTAIKVGEIFRPESVIALWPLILT